MHPPLSLRLVSNERSSCWICSNETPSVRTDDAEITFQSSDNVLFKIHATNLKARTAGFSPPECSTFHEVVSLSETSSTLELLFKFIYPVIQPDLQSVEFDVLANLAEAAEKYQVFSAMSLCRFYMS